MRPYWCVRPGAASCALGRVLLLVGGYGVEAMEESKHVVVSFEWLESLSARLGEGCSGCPCLGVCKLCRPVVDICQEVNLVLRSARPSEGAQSW